MTKLERAIAAKQAQIDAAEKELAELRKELHRIEELARKEDT